MSDKMTFDAVLQAYQKQADSLGITVYELAEKALREFAEKNSRTETIEKALTASFRDFDEAYRKLAQ